MSTLLGVDELWLEGWRGPSILRVDDDGFAYVGPATATTHSVTVLPGLMDSHVHLGLIDATRLVPGGIARVLDLGWIPEIASTWTRRADATLPETTIAGALLAPPDGYPRHAGWAPAAAVMEVADAEAAAAAITHQQDLGAEVIKLTLNSVAGSTFRDELLASIVGIAHDAGLPVVAHAEGAGQAARAAAAGVDVLAHAPFSERLDDEVLAKMVGEIAWISTLDIHGWGEPTAAFEIAVDNVRRFAGFGGEIRYGTDLGNGPLPVGVNEREVAALALAGLGVDALVRSIVGPASAMLGNRVSVVTKPRPDDPADVARWLATSHVTGTSDLARFLS